MLTMMTKRHQSSHICRRSSRLDPHVKAKPGTRDRYSDCTPYFRFPRPVHTFSTHSHQLIYVSRSFLLIGGAVLVVVGFSIAADSGFNTPSSYGIIIAAVVTLTLSFINFAYTQRIPIIPPVRTRPLERMTIEFGSHLCSCSASVYSRSGQRLCSCSPPCSLPLVSSRPIFSYTNYSKEYVIVDQALYPTN